MLWNRKRNEKDAEEAESFDKESLEKKEEIISAIRYIASTVNEYQKQVVQNEVASLTAIHEVEETFPQLMEKDD